MKYPINKEFFPFSHIAPPIRNAKIAGWMGSKMKPPRWVNKNRDHEVSTKKENIKSYDGAEISLLSLILTDLRRSLLALFTITAADFSLRGRDITTSSQSSMLLSANAV